MSTTIEQLEVEIKSKSNSVSSGIDSLSESLKALKTATSGTATNLGQISNSLKQLNTTLTSINTTHLNELVNNLKNISSVKVSNAISDGLKNIGSAASGLNGVDFTKLNTLSSALNSLNTVSGKGLSDVAKALNDIPNIAKSFEQINWDEFITKVTQLSSALSALSVQLNNVNTNSDNLPTNLQQATTATNNLVKSNKLAVNSYTDLYSLLKMSVVGLRSVGSVIASWMNTASTYIEDMNLFTVSMGQYAEEAQVYAETVSEALGIDPGQFMRYEGVFNTIIKGFGVVEDKAYLMSKNLTQLGYDISSFANISYEDAMLKLQSGISGELEPLRRLGYDLSVARLQQEAYTLGINKSVESMTQAEKSQLRYYAIMTQVTDAQLDMGSTINAPANQLRVLQAQVTQCAKALGNLFLPILQKVLPYLIAFAKAVRYVLENIAALFGIELTDFTQGFRTSASAMSEISDSVADTSSGLGDATKAAKKLKSAVLGIDELNILSPDTSSSSGSGESGSGGSGGIGAGGDLGIDLPDYDILEKLAESKVNKIFESMKENLNKILGLCTGIGLAIASWKITTNVLKFIEVLENFKGFKWESFGLGSIFMAGDIEKFSRFMDDILTNGANFQNVTGLISESIGILGNAFIMLGRSKIGGAFKAVEGIGELVSAITDIAINGVNFDNVSTAIKGISDVIIAFGLIKGNYRTIGIGLILASISTAISELKNVIEAIKTGDWDIVNWGTLLISAIGIITGIALAFNPLNGIKSVGNSIKNASSTMSAVTDATNATSACTEGLNTATSSISTKLTSLAKNLLMGIAIIAEVAAAALIIVGTIALLGLELKYVVEAWTPVIENGKTATIAVGTGTAILVAIGVVTAALGTLGASIAIQIGIGVAILAEISLATDLFLAEILVIGILLNKIYEAWTPVLNNGKTIATAIGVGTGLLVAIGVVTAALGVATVASVGLLPVAIALGTALLIELSEATILFCNELVRVANALNYKLYPVIVALNSNLPTLTLAMHNFVNFMINFAREIVRYTASNIIASLASTIDTIIGWFTEDPIEHFAKSVDDVYNQTLYLNAKLALAVPELQTAIKLLKSYKTFLEQLEDLTNVNVELSSGMFVNMKEVGQNLVVGFTDGIKSKSSEFSSAATTLVNGFKTTLMQRINECKSVMLTWAKNLKTWFTSKSFGGINAETWKNYAKDIVNGFKTGLSGSYANSKSVITTWAVNIKNWFSQKSYGGICAETWSEYAKNIVTAFSNGINKNYMSNKSSLVAWGNNVKNWFNKPNGITLADEFETIGKNVIRGFINGSSDSELWKKAKKKIQQFANEIIEAAEDTFDIGSPSKVFKSIGSYVIEGFNIGIESMLSSTYSIMNQWVNTVSSYTPTLALAVDSSQLASINTSPHLTRATIEDVQYSYKVDATNLSDGLETFYKQYIEPTLKSMAADVKRQADKDEQTIVKIGNKTITDTITAQQKANGYSFIK